MKRFQSIAALVLAVCIGMSVLFGASAQGESVPKTAIVIVGSINVREQPGESAGIIGGLTIGKEVTVLDTVNLYGMDWYKIPYKDGVGYITSKYARIVMGVGMVTLGALNVRSLPSTASVRLGGLSQGDGVIILEQINNAEGSWFLIPFNGTNAYVLASAIDYMQLPAAGYAYASYKKNVTIRAIVHNVPEKYRVEVDGRSFDAQGTADFSADVLLGQIREDRDVVIRVYDADGRIRDENTVTIVVENGFGARLAAFFRFVFSGFRWGDQLIEIG